MPRHQSVWSATTALPECGRLQENVHADVCIIGAGIAGLSTAYHVCKAGKSVAADASASVGGRSGGRVKTCWYLSNNRSKMACTICSLLRKW